ncbi:MAG TPA: PRC-barrel domain-containing protein [Longimicrobiales bacterium]|nr:PRC-barrel domain-containing protein [Longimicrobiales bacterium]
MAKNKDRSRRDQSGIGPDPETARRHRLVAMHDLDGYTIADGEPDIRGWDVRTLNGREIGEIEDLLIDTERGEVVMIEVELRDGGVHAEVPIRSVQLDRENKAVIVDSGDIDARHDQRPRDRMKAVERHDEVRDARGDVPRSVTYGASERDSDRGLIDDDTEEVVIERRPVIEEVVVRRKVVDEE